MAYREVAMWEILAVLERIGRGESKAAVARVTGYTRKTIRGYVRSAESLGWKPGTDPPSQALAAKVFLRHRCLMRFFIRSNSAVRVRSMGTGFLKRRH